MTLETEIKQVRPFRNSYHKAFVNIIFSGKWLLQFVADMLKPYDITPQQYNILRILRGKYPEPTSLKSIRESMLDRMSDASRIVELLRIKELLERNICEDNRRQVDIYITQKGLKLLDEIENENENMDNQLSSLDDEEIIHLNFLLDKVRNRKKNTTKL